MKKFSKLSFVLLLFTSLFDFVGLSVAATLFPAIILNDVNHLLAIDTSLAIKITVIGLLMGVYPLGQLFGASFFGKLSDRLGRKSTLLITVAGTIIGTVICGIAIEVASIALLFIGRIFAGFCAGNIAIAQAAVMDMSDDHNRGQNISTFQSGMGMGWVVGPVMGGLLSNSSGLFSNIPSSTPIWCVAVFLSVIFILLTFFFKETLQEKNTSKFVVLEGFYNFAKAFTYKGLRTYFLVWGLFVGGWMLAEQFFPTFLYNHWQMTQLQTGLLIGSTGLLFAFTQIYISRPLSKRFSSSTIVKAGVTLTGISLIGMGLATTIPMLCEFTFLFVVSIACGLSALITQISLKADPARQGEVMGIIGSIQALTTIISAMSAGSIIGVYNNFGLLTGGLMMILGAFIYSQSNRFYVAKQIAVNEGA